MSSMLTFNMDDGFLEAEVRGQKLGLLGSADYVNLTQCETVDDMKMHLSHTDYGVYLQNEPSPISSNTLWDRCWLKLVKDFQHIRAQAVEPLATFLDYITYGPMIDNVVLLITGCLHGKDISELITKCNPLGMFESIESLSVVTSPRDLYSTVLIDTPLAPYFAQCLSIDDLNEMNMEIIRQTLYKAYLEDFFRFVNKIGGPTADVMIPILEYEADRRTINITLNSFGTELGADDRKKLYPEFGRLYPEGIAHLLKAEDPDQVRVVCDGYVTYRQLFIQAETSDRTLEDCFYTHEVHLNKLAFLQQYGYGVFYAIVKLREQEIRNLVWIAECIAQDVRSKINNYVPLF